MNEESERELEQIHSPQKDDLLVRSDLRDWWNNSHVNPTWGDPKHGYTEGYRRGALLLAAHVNEHHRNQDYLVYPIIFLYRHHIELALKNIIMQTPYVLSRELTEMEKRHLGRHRLDLLWQDLKPLLSTIAEAADWSPNDADEIGAVDVYIKQLSTLDPDSFRFRYTAAKDGSPTLSPELKVINLRHFANMMERLANYFDGLETGLSILAEGKTEMHHENYQHKAWPSTWITHDE